MKAHRYFFLFQLLMVFLIANAEAAWVYDNGEMQRKEECPYLHPQEHYRTAREAFLSEDWTEAVDHFYIVAANYSDTSFGQDAYFFLGISYYKLRDYDLANTAMNNYLSCQSNPCYFEEAIEYKYCIAENFRRGARRHFYGSRFMPKWGGANTTAIDVYDEVISAVPSHELATKSLFSKACLQWKMRNYKDSIDTYQSVIRLFPKHELAPLSYENIARIYIDQAKLEVQNPDLLAFAQINLSRFEADFPREERLETTRLLFDELKEVYAEGLYDIARFYERICKPKASVIYYQKAIYDFPNTCVANACRDRLSRLCPEALNFKLKEELEEDAAEEPFPGIPEEIEFVDIPGHDDSRVEYANILEDKMAA